jgi:hypothetical protein
MATRSTIALEYADGTVFQIYCHWDGYLETNGKILAEHYSDPFKVQKLLGLGDISSLGESIGIKHPFNVVPGTSYSDHERLYGHMTNAYGRDRGESGTDARRFKDFAEYEANGQREEFNYILRKSGQWFVACDNEYAPLLDALAALPA